MLKWMKVSERYHCLSVSNGHLHFDTRGDGDGGDLLDDFRWRLEVDQALVNAHLELVPGVGTFTAWRLAGGDLELLGGKADWALDLEVLVLGRALEVSANFLQVLHVEGSQGDADAVDASFLVDTVLLSRGEHTRHDEWGGWG